MADAFDVVVIGAGPGGYIAAIRCAQLGLKTACIEEWQTQGKPVLGGTCLNVGCIPSKALLESSEHYEALSHSLSAHGIAVSGVKLDIEKMLARKDSIVAKMTAGIELLFRKNKITWLKGQGGFVGKQGTHWQIAVMGGSQVVNIEASSVIVATGSRARHLPGVPVDNQLICDNEGALNFKAVPRRLGIIGAGVIGLELGSVWRRLGASVTILEALPTFLASADEAVAKEAWKCFTKDQGLDIRLGVKIGEIKSESKSGKALVQVQFEHEGKSQRLEFDNLIVSVGRVPNTQGLGAETIGLKVDARGFIEVDGSCRTGLPGVYAIGDVVRGPMLAHKAEEEGVLVAELIAGQKPHLDLATIPWVIYTSPEIAWVGKTEQQLKSEGVAYKIGQFPFLANGRALGQGDSRGFVKILAHAQSDEILGVHIVNSRASELISEAVVAMEFKASAEDIARIVHAHPSLSEVMREAALAVDKRSLNM